MIIPRDGNRSSLEGFQPQSKHLLGNFMHAFGKKHARLAERIRTQRDRRFKLGAQAMRGKRLLLVHEEIYIWVKRVGYSESRHEISKGKSIKN